MEDKGRKKIKANINVVTTISTYTLITGSCTLRNLKPDIAERINIEEA